MRPFSFLLWWTVCFALTAGVLEAAHGGAVLEAVAVSTVGALAYGLAATGIGWILTRPAPLRRGWTRLRNHGSSRAFWLGALVVLSATLVVSHRLLLRLLERFYWAHIAPEWKVWIFSTLPILLFPVLLSLFLAALGLWKFFFDRWLAARAGGFGWIPFVAGIVLFGFVGPYLYLEWKSPSWLALGEPSERLSWTVLALAHVLVIGLWPALAASRRGRIGVGVAAALLAANVARLQVVGPAPDRHHRLAHRSLFARHILRAAYPLTDFDGDGASGLLGGGDPAGFDPAIHPFRLGGPCAVPPPPRGEETYDGRGKDIVLITIDSLRPDVVGPRLTPNLEAALGDAFRFTRCITHGPETSTGMTSILWGARRKAVLESMAEGGGRLRSLADELRAAGYHTIGVCSVEGLRHAHYSSGFERYENLTTGDPFVDRQVSLTAPMHRTLLAALDDRPAGKPMFLWVHYYDPHERYLPHPGSPVTGSAPRDLYEQEVWHTDVYLGRLFERIRAQGRWDSTIIVLMGDHGEAFGEHGRRLHATTLYDEMTHVPLRIRLPDVAGRSLDFPVSSLDIVPTLLAWAGLSAGDRRRGRDLTPQMIGETAPIPWPVLSEITWGEADDAGAIWLGSEKLILHRFTHAVELFDLRADPGETKNLAAERPARVAELRRIFLLHMGGEWP
jgi:arylsulfatase A-like enzyme